MLLVWISKLYYYLFILFEITINNFERSNPFLRIINKITKPSEKHFKAIKNDDGNKAKI